MVNILKKELDMPYDDAVAKVKEKLAKHGFSVLVTKALDEIFKEKLGVTDYARFTMIVACNPKLAKMALDVSLNVGSVFPCSFIVHEQDKKIYVSHLSIMKTAVEIGLASAESMESVIKTTGKYVHAVWDEL